MMKILFSLCCWIYFGIAAVAASLSPAIAAEPKRKARRTLAAVEAGVNILVSGYTSADEWVLNTSTPFASPSIYSELVYIDGFNLDARNEVAFATPMNDSEAQSCLEVINIELLPALYKFTNDSAVQILPFEALGLCDDIYNLILGQKALASSFIEYVQEAAPKDQQGTFGALVGDVYSAIDQWGISFQANCTNSTTPYFADVDSTVGQISYLLNWLYRNIYAQPLISYEAIYNMSATLTDKLQDATESASNFTALSDVESRGCIGDFLSLAPLISSFVNGTIATRPYIQAFGECKNISSMLYDMRKVTINYIDTVSAKASSDMESAIRSVTLGIDAAFDPGFIAFTAKNCVRVPVSSVFETIQSALLNSLQSIASLCEDLSIVELFYNGFTKANSTIPLVLGSLQNTTDTLSQLELLNEVDAHATLNLFKMAFVPTIKLLVATSTNDVDIVMLQSLCEPILDFFTRAIPLVGNLTTVMLSKMPPDQIFNFTSISNATLTELETVRLLLEPGNCTDGSG